MSDSSDARDPAAEPARAREARSSRRARILRCAIEAFARHGYEGTTTAAVARRSGVTQPLVHYHFGSKKGLWRAAVDLLFEDVHARFGHIDDELQGRSPPELVRILVRRFVDLCAERPEIAQIVLREAVRRNERFTWLVERHIAPLVQGVAGLIGRIQAAHARVRIPPLHLLFVVMGGANLPYFAPALFEALAGRPPTDPGVIEAHAQALIELLEQTL